MNPNDAINPYKISPTVDPDNLLSVSRDRILQIILNSMVVFGVISYALSFLSSSGRKDWLLIFVYTVLLVFVILLSFLRTMRLGTRAVLVLSVLYILGLTALLDSGLSGSGRFFLAVLPLMAAAMLGVGAGVTFSVLGVGTLLGVGWLLTSGTVLPLLPDTIGMIGGFSDWGASALVYVALVMISTPAVFLMIVGLERAANNQKTLTTELTAERNSLEDRVEARTSELQRRTFELETISSLAHEISTSDDLDGLLQKSVEIIHERFQYYYIAVFLVDKRREHIELRAWAGQSGRIMLPDHLRVKFDENSFIGRVAINAQTRVLSEDEKDPLAELANRLPESRSEIALPLVAAGKTLGVIDIHSAETDAFFPQDVRLLSNLADQLSVGIQKANLLDQIQSHLAEVEDNYQEYTRETWRSHFVSARKKHAYRYRGNVVEPLSNKSEYSEKAYLEGISQITSLENDPQTGQPVTVVAVPIKLRRQTLGVAEVRFSTPVISDATVSLLETAMNRLSLALENARLLEAIQMRADQEHLVSEITSKVRTSTDIDGILRTTALELGRSLGVSGVKVQLRTVKTDDQGSPQ